jgi:hypothetical protein
VISTPLFENGVRPHHSLDELVAEAQLIFTGEVGQSQAGFFDGRPVTLLGVSGLEVLRSSALYNHDSLYLTYPETSFRIGGRYFCNEDQGLPPLPVTGTRLLVFAYFPPKDLAGHVVELHHFDVLLEGEKGLWIPFTLEKDPVLGTAKTLSEAVEKTKEKLAGESGS